MVGKIADGNVDEWYQELAATASRVEKIGDESLMNGHRISAHEAYLRASNRYLNAFAFMASSVMPLPKETGQTQLPSESQ